MTRAVLFDLDGTLIDSAPDIAASMNDVLAERRLAPFTVPEVRAMIGDGAAELVRRAFAARQATQPDDGLERFREVYGRRCVETTQPYPGIVALLAELSRSSRRVAVVTNKPTAFSERILEALELAPHVAAVIGPERAAEKKPSPRHVEAALLALGTPASGAVMVGDGPTDMKAGAAAGTDTIGVLWGYRSEDELRAAGAGTIVREVRELRDALLG